MSLSVTFLDFLVVLVVVVSAGYAAWRGFLWETLTIFAWVSAAFACLYFGPYIVPLTRSMVSEAWLASVIAYAAVFLAVFIPMAFMSARLSDGVKHSPIGPLDRAAGVAFGVVRGLVIVGLAYLAFTYFVPIRQQPNWMTEARLLPAIQSTAEVLLSVVPDRDRDFAEAPARAEVVRQAPGALPATSTPSPSASRDAQSHDPMADLIRKGAPQATVSPAPAPKSAARSKKSYGAEDREGLDKLIQSGGSAKP